MVATRRVKGFVKPAGMQVILAHRLLKNSVARDEYILLSEDFFNLHGEIAAKEVQRHVESYEGFGTIRSMVYCPNKTAQGSAARATFLSKVAARTRLAMGTVKWLLRPSDLRKFKSLQGL